MSSELIPFEPITDAFAEQNFAKLRDQWSEVPFRELIAKTVRQLGPEIEDNCLGYMMSLNANERAAAELLIDLFNVVCQSQDFWGVSCSQTVLSVRKSFDKLMNAKGHPLSEAAKYAMFQVLVLNFARTVRDNPASRAHAGIELTNHSSLLRGLSIVAIAGFFCFGVYILLKWLFLG